MGKIIFVGLGNPGPEYRSTRHNLGFMLADLISGRFERERGAPFLISENTDFIVIKPMTYMNRSGIAVRCIMEKEGVEACSLLVACDDFNLPLGKLRIRPEGSSGGHNGLNSIIECIGTDKFPRIRLGIGGAEIPDKTAYVLSGFSKNEIEPVEIMVRQAAEAVRFCAENGLEEAMNRYN